MSLRSGKLPFLGSEDEFLTIGVRTNMRRYTRLSNGFSRKLENHAAATALNYFAYNFIKVIVHFA